MRGEVISGRGKASAVIAKFSKPLEAHFGRRHFGGTLNIVLPKPVRLDPESAMIAEQFWPAQVNGMPCLVHRWSACPLHIFEIVSDRNLRDFFKLRDGSAVELSGLRFARLPLSHRLAWNLLWQRRQKLYYVSDKYESWTLKRTSLSWMSVQGG